MREFSAGGLVYWTRAGRVSVLLAARRHPQSGGLVWTIPKGHLERGETSEQAAVREVREETGIEAAIEARLGDVTYWYVRKAESGATLRILKRVRFFLMRRCGGRFADRDAEMDAVRWIPLDEAEAVPTFETERALVRKAREMLR